MLASQRSAGEKARAVGWFMVRLSRLLTLIRLVLGLPQLRRYQLNPLATSQIAGVLLVVGIIPVHVDAQASQPFHRRRMIRVVEGPGWRVGRRDSSTL